MIEIYYFTDSILETFTATVSNEYLSEFCKGKNILSIARISF